MRLLFLWSLNVVGAVASSGLLSQVTQGGAASYTKNSVCMTRFCINPIFPALNFLGESVFATNQAKTWKCANTKATPSLWKVAGFCSKVIAGYPFAITEDVTPAPGAAPAASPLTEADLISKQSSQALAAYVAHISGMGFDLWQYTEPWNHDECIQSIWKLACETYFPRCNMIVAGQYLRPCSSSCNNYVQACKVECCDEGVQCVYQHVKTLGNGSSMIEDGYADHHGPSPLCTGGAHRGERAFGAFALVLLSLLQVSL